MTILAATYVAIIGASLLVLYTDFEARARDVVVIQAEKYSLGWAEFLAHGLGTQSTLFDGTALTDAERRFLESATTVPGIFQVKLFDDSGRLLLLSGPSGLNPIANGDRHADVAREVARSGLPQSFIKDGRAKPDRPDVYVETYLPVFIDGSAVGVAEVYLDESAEATRIREQFIELGLILSGTIFIVLLLPTIAVLVVLRRLNMQRRALVRQRVRAERAERVKADFMARMSHDLRTPLNSILGFSDLMRSGIGRSSDPKVSAEYANLIHRSGTNMLGLVNDILDLSVIESSKATVNPRPIDLNEALSSCVEEVRAAAGDRDVAISVDLPDPVPVPVVDPHAFNRIATNILSNAVKFTPDGGSVSIDASCRNEMVAIRFRDSGIGISQDEINQITEPFAQAGSDPHLAQQGVGLGLAIVRALLIKADGKLEIDSAPGRGTDVTVYLPALT